MNEIAVVPDEAPPPTENPEDATPADEQKTTLGEYRALPNNLEVEQALLGAILVNNGALDKVLGFLDPEHFYEEAHGRIYDAICRLVEKGQSADPVKLKPYFENDEALANVGGAAYLVRMAASAATIINAEDYGRTIYDLALRREIITVGQDMVLSAYDSPVDDDARAQIERAENHLHGLATRGTGLSSAVSFRRASEEMEAQVAAAHERDGIVGVPTGLKDLDDAIGGFRAGKLYIVAGRTSMGKTTVATVVSRAAAQANNTVLFVSLEMTREDLVLRMVSDIAHMHGDRIEYDRAEKGFLTAHELGLLAQHTDLHRSLPIVIIDDQEITIAGLRALARGVKRRLEQSNKTLGLVVVDYLQLMAPMDPRAPRVQQVSEITRGLKMLAKQLGVPVLALSQLSRNIEHRENKRPLLSDLRESGTIEQDADVVIFCYREEYYLEKEEPGADTPEHEAWEAKIAPVRNIMELGIGKQRSGPTGRLVIMSDMGCSALRDRAPQSQEQLL